MTDPGAVSSAANAKLKAVRALRDGRDRAGVLLEGRHLLEEALAASAALRWVLHDEGAEVDAGLAALLDEARARGAEVQPCDPALLRVGSDLDAPTGLLAWADRPTTTVEAVLANPAVGDWCLVACGVQDPGNLGALARIAAGLGASGLVAMKGGVSPWHPRALRGASGTTLRLPVAERAPWEGTVAALKTGGWRIFGADAGGHAPSALRAARATAPVALLLGEEGRGLPPEAAAACEATIGIPLARGVESLNVATAAAILAWELRSESIGRDE